MGVVDNHYTGDSEKSHASGSCHTGRRPRWLIDGDSVARTVDLSVARRCWRSYGEPRFFESRAKAWTTMREGEDG